jgi:hypothetical protein
LDEKQGTMSSPYARCSLLHDYHRNNYKKFNYNLSTAADRKRAASSSYIASSSASSTTTTTTSSMISQKVNSDSDLSLGTSVHRADNASNSAASTAPPGSIVASYKNGTNQNNQDIFVEHFDTSIINSDLNPVWRNTSNLLNGNVRNIGSFQVQHTQDKHMIVK